MLELTSKQKDLARCVRDYKYILSYGGSRGGKTFGLVSIIVSLALQIPGTRHLITRRYATDVRASIWKLTLFDVLAAFDLHPGTDYQKNEVDMEITFPNGSKIICAGLDDAQRVDKILGQEYSTIYINESQDVPWQSVKILRTRLSQKLTKNRLIADLNPTSTAHWTYKLWFEKVDPETGNPLDYPEAYGKVSISPYDNRDNLGEDYISHELETKTGNDRRRFLLGEYATTSELTVFSPQSYFTQADFLQWVEIVGKEAVRIVGGLDLGYEDADALSFIAWADGDPRTWLIHEYKQRKSGITELADAVKEGLKYCRQFTGLDIPIYTDTGGGGAKIASELYATYGLPVTKAYKRDKALGIDLLQDEVNTPGRLHVREGGHFDTETRKIVWTRDLNGTILRVIDDKAYHPDMMDAILYPFRYLWSYGGEGLKKGVSIE